MIKETETPEEVYFVATAMRDADLDEIQAVTGVDITPEFLTEFICRSPGTTWTSWANGVPVAVFGFVPMWPGVVNLYAFGTDDWGKGLLSMTKWLKTGIFDQMRQLDVHRCECRAKADRKDVYRWLTSLGADVEGRHSQYGRDKSDFICYAWTMENEQTAQAN